MLSHIRQQLETISNLVIEVIELQLWALNTDQSAGCEAKLIFREWHDRLNFAAPAVVSNQDDPELLIHVPFDGTVKLKAICVIGECLNNLGSMILHVILEKFEH